MMNDLDIWMASQRETDLYMVYSMSSSQRVIRPLPKKQFPHVNHLYAARAISTTTSQLPIILTPYHTVKLPPIWWGYQSRAICVAGLEAVHKRPLLQWCCVARSRFFPSIQAGNCIHTPHYSLSHTRLEPHLPTFELPAFAQLQFAVESIRTTSYRSWDDRITLSTLHASVLVS